MCRAKTFRSLLAFALLTRFSNSTLVNQTIDDGLGDLRTGLKVQYLPTTNDSDELVWKSQDTCGDTCPVNPDSTEAHNNTWSSATCIGSETVSATFAFRGTAIYIYFIISRYTLPSGAIAAANCEFWVDGQVVGSFVQIPLPGVIEYNTLVYANNSLSDALHTFSIRARSDSFLIFDYAQYTAEFGVTVPLGPESALPGPTSGAGTTSTTSTSSVISTSSVTSASSVANTSSITSTMKISGATSPAAAPPRQSAHTGAIAGGTVAGLAGVALIALGVILYRRHATSGNAPTISSAPPRKTRRGHVSPFILAGAPPIFSIPPSKIRSEYIGPFTSQDEAGLERWTPNPPREIATPGRQGVPSTQGWVSKLAQSRWKGWRSKFNERARKELPPGLAARPIPVLVGSPSSNVFE